jgi:hypothetical protein
MPRRNNRIRRRRQEWTRHEYTREETYEQMARSLVLRGLASPMILDSAAQHGPFNLNRRSA